MKKTICSHLYLLGAVLVLVGILGITSPVFAGSESLSPEKIYSLAREYQNRITLADQEIQTLKENLVWLEFKIERMGKLKRAIPLHLYTSVFYKKERIQALELSRQNFAEYLVKVQARMPVDSVQDTGLRAGQIALVEEELKTAGLMDWFEVVEDPSGMAVKTRLPILFTSGSAVIAEEYAPFLEKVSAFMKDHGAWAIVDGFTDINPIKTKQFASNFELGAIRAANIVHALVKYGSDPAFFKVSTTGQYRFPDARPASKEKAMERYVNITLVFDGEA